MTTTVADVIVDGLVRAGTTRVFSGAAMTGGDGWLDAFRRRGLSVVQVSRTSDACVMAAASGALGGVPGATVIGAGLADAADGLAYAFSHRLPTVVIGAGDSSAAAPPHRPDLAGITKATLAVGAGSAAHWIAHACRLAMTEPWGPVRLEVPLAVESAATLPVATMCRPDPPPAPDSSALDDAARLLGAADRPLVVAGLLCRSEADAAWLRAFAEARPAPVLVTPRARGVLPDPHPLVIGTLGGGDAERTLLESADLIVAVGLDPVEMRPHTWPAETTVLHLTPVASESLGRDRGMAVVGDIGLILEELAPRLRDARLAEWDVGRLHGLKQMAGTPPTAAERLAAYRVAETARRLTPPGAIAVFEAGEGSAAVARAWLATAPGECLISSGGFVLPTTLAAQLAHPERRVVCFVEAAALHADADRLQTVARLGLPVLIVAFDHSDAPSLISLARHAGLGVLASPSIAAFDAAFERALTAMTPALVDVCLGAAGGKKEG